MTVFTRPIAVPAFKITAVTHHNNEATVTLVGNVPLTPTLEIGDYIVLLNGMLTIEKSTTFNSKYYDQFIQPGVVGQINDAATGDIAFEITETV